MQRKVKEILPKTFEELKALSQDDRARLWAKYSQYPFKRQMRSLLYYIQCDRLNLRIEHKYLVKIRKYKDNPKQCLDHACLHRTTQPQVVFYPQLPLIRAKAIKKHPMQGGFYLWRMGRDSNPRKSCPFSGFQDRRIRPLCHPSETVLNRRSFKPVVLFVARVLVTVRVYSIFIFYALQL